MNPTVFRLASRTLWARKRRLVGLVLAVVIGTAFLSGALTLSDTLKSSITGLISKSGSGTDVVVRNATSVTSEPGTQRAGIDANLLGPVAAVPKVAVAEPQISGYGQLVGKDGKALTGNGPRQAGNWLTDDALNPWKLRDGRAPAAPGEVVVDAASAKQGHLKPGDQISVLTPQPVPVTVVGIAKFGDADSFGGSSYTAFTLDGARQHLSRDAARISTIAVRAAAGTDEEALAAAVQKVLPPTAQAISGAAATGEQTQSVEDGFLSIFRTAISAFAVIALVVAAVSIHHTFNVVTAQRMREAALLRALGASRRQVLAQSVVEALLIGVIASVAGLFAGIALALGLNELFTAAGVAFPISGLTFKSTTVAIVLPVGILTTLVSALVPAVRSSKTAPIAALHDTAAERTELSKGRTLAGFAVLLLGVAVSIYAAVAGSLTGLAVGAPAVLAGVLLLAPAAVRSAAGPATAPLPRLRGAAGLLARGNVLRSPRRTAGAATAMIVGIAVVSLFAVFTASLGKGVGDETRKSVSGQLVVGGTSPAGWAAGGHSPELTATAVTLPQVEAVTGIQGAMLLLDGKSKTAVAVDSARVSGLLDLDVKSGGIDGLGPQGIAVAEDTGLALGGTVEAVFPDGAGQRFTVRAVYNRTQLVGDYVIDRQAWAPHAVTNLDSATVVALKPGTSVSDGKKALKAIATPFGAPEVRDVDGFVEARTAMLATMMTVMYVLLALALIIALGGNPNTLSLAVHERTRELGLLRAVGASRAQVRSALRWESVVTASLGVAAGLGLGVFLGWAALGALAGSLDLAFTLPVTQLVVLLVVGVLGGFLAAVRPASRAAKLNVLRAVAAD